MLVDGFGRKVNYLRISVTERCNFRCQYCMPEKPFSWVPKENLLSFEDLFLFVKVAIDEGIDKIRITGGEPLLRYDLDKFIAMINKHKPGLDLALTTNGFLMKEYAQKLYDAGLKRANISLDSLKDSVAQQIAQKDVLKNVKEGIDEALHVGLKIKINMVPLKGINDVEVLDVLEYAKAKGISIRFIEYMENRFAKEKLQGLSAKEIESIVGTKYSFEEIGREGSSPAHMYRFEDGYKFGIIDPHNHDFCEDCNRIRLTAEGVLIPCLYFDEAMSIKEAVQKGDILEASLILKEVLKNKPEKNKWSNDDTNETSNRAFYETGG
ncbi:MAG: GTP 3',8-cyclase MoaA [Sulfurospirillaceae bacterium]|nr:GTP 3',8-cyclase MoaA [Sulfurospirillaceae bacterium]